MAEKKASKLFAEFPPVTTEQWEAVINADLKGADYERKLVWKTAEGFNVRPYYRAEDLAALRHLNSKPGEFPYVRGNKECNEWLIRENIKVECPKEANAQALEILMKGVNSLGFTIKNKEFAAADLEALLQGIDIKAVELNFGGCGAAAAAKCFIAKINASGLDKHDVRASFDIDPIVRDLTVKGGFCCGDGSKCFGGIKDMVKEAGIYKRVKFATVNGTAFHNAGSTIVQELAFTLAAGHEYVIKLSEAGLSTDDAAATLKFNMGISSNYFMEIAKFRAARMLWANIMKAYNPTRGCASKMRINAVTSQWNMTIYDPNVNMLRATTEAMSAALANIESIEVLPFDKPYHCQGTDFSRRIARNVQLLLKEESHFDKVVDPAAGSYYVETLTNSIAEQAWKLFKEIEDMGGYIEAVKAGFVQDTIAATAAKRDMNIATRRETLLGTNQFPNFLETADADVTPEDMEPGCCCKGTSCCETSVKTLKPYRGAMAFERMRYATDKSGKTPKAFMLTVGNLAFARARSQFASNFFACAGIRPVDNIMFASVEEGLKAAMEAKAEIVVLCSSDDEYATLAPEAFKALDGKAIFVVAGQPACAPELEAVGIKNFISVKSNVLETLRGYQKELGI